MISYQCVFRFPCNEWSFYNSYESMQECLDIIWVFEQSKSLHTVTVFEVINDCMNKVSFVMIVFLLCLPADLKLSLTVFEVLHSISLRPCLTLALLVWIHQGWSFTDGLFGIKTGNVSIFWSYGTMATCTLMTISHV